MLVLACNPRCLGVGDWPEPDLRPAWAKLLARASPRQINQAWWYPPVTPQVGGLQSRPAQAKA